MKLKNNLTISEDDLGSREELDIYLQRVKELEIKKQSYFKSILNSFFFVVFIIVIISLFTKLIKYTYRKWWV